MHELNTCFLVRPVCLCSQRTAKCPHGEVAMACTSSLYTSAQVKPTQDFISLSHSVLIYLFILDFVDKAEQNYYERPEF